MSTLATLNVVLNGDIGGFLKAMKEAEGKSSESSNIIQRALGGIGDVAKVAAGVAVAGIGAMTGAAVAGVTAFNSWADTLDSLGDVLGTNADESAALAVAIKGVGGDVDGITGQMAKLAKGLDDGTGKTTAIAKEMQSLGIAFKGSNGQLLSTTQILTNVADKLAKMPDGLEKTRIMTQLFGKSGKDLSDTMNALANGGLKNAADKAKALGLAIGDDGVNRSIEFGKSLETLKMSAEGIAVSIGSTLMPILQPAIQQFSDWAVSVMPQVRAGLESVFNWIQANVGPIIQGAITWLQGAVAWVQANWPLIQSTIQGVFDQINAYIGPVLTAIDGVIRGVFGAISQFLNTHGEEIKGFVSGAWNAIQGIVSTIAEILRTIVTGVFGGIRDFINDNQSGIQVVFQGVWDTIKIVVGSAIEVVRGVVNAALALLRGDVNGALNAIKGIFTGIWEQIRTTVSSAANSARMLAILAIDALKTGVSNILNGLRTFFEGAWNGIIDFLHTLPDRLYNIGKTIIEGLWNGIKSMFQNITKGLSDFFNNAINDIKKSLGIQSPSKVYEQIGTQMMRGLALGIDGGARLPQLALDAALSGITANVSAVGHPAASGNTDSRSYVYNNYINDSLAARILAEQQRQESLQSIVGMM